MGLGIMDLIEHGKRANADGVKLWDADSLLHLSEGKRLAWGRFLLSIATTEALEDLVICPLAESFRGDATVQDAVRIDDARCDRRGDTAVSVCRTLHLNPQVREKRYFISTVRLGHLPSNLGARFSMNAFTPSL